MKRICLMVFRNILMVPFWYLKLCYYARNRDKISEEKKLALFKEIIAGANRAGNVKVRSYGVEQIPKSQSFMFFPNHQGLYDVLALLDGSPRFFSVVMKKELEHLPFLSLIFRIMGAYSMDREDVRQSMKVIQKVSQEVKDGKNFLIFPEGTRSRDPRVIGSFKGGSFKSATKARCPIVPVCIKNAYRVFDIGSTAPVTVEVHYLKPLYYEEYENMKTTEIAEEVERRIRKAMG